MASNYIWDFPTDSYLEEVDDNGVKTASYTCEPVRFGGVISQVHGGLVRIFHYDGQWNTTELTDENENVTDTRG